MTDQPTDLVRLLSRIQAIAERDDVPDYEITNVQRVTMTAVLGNGSVVTFTLDGDQQAALRLLFDPENKQKVAFQFMTTGDRVTVRRSGVATHGLEMW